MEESAEQHSEPSDSASRVLSVRQQNAASVVLVVCLGFMLLNMVARWSRQKRLIDIERPFDKRPISLTIDLNQAEWPELTLLPEIGETMARRIVEYREVQGQFGSLDELKKVRGIGPRTFQQVREYLEPIQPLPAMAEQ